jgi:hypothetical protein
MKRNARHALRNTTALALGIHLALAGLGLAPGPAHAADYRVPPDTRVVAAPKPRVPSLDLTIAAVPWGMAYDRSGLAANIRYQTPLINRPGVLWEKTNITVGVRDAFGYVNNSLAAFAEVTPIGFFKLQVSAAYDTFFVNPFSGGTRVLTALGRTQLAEGNVARGRAGAVDWVNGKNDHAIFNAPIAGDGVRLKIQPTLQGKVGPIAAQYTFTADFNVYRSGRYGCDDVYHDTFTFTLRKLCDHGFLNELLVVYEIPNLRDEVRFGVVGKYFRVAGTGLDNLNVGAVGFYRPRLAVFGERFSPWITAQLGTNLRDPMYRYAFAWVVALGVDLKLL